jgi:hypothetical protein
MTISGINPPEWCEDLLKQFGQNPWGENIFRVVWAPRRIVMYGGYWADDGIYRYRYAKKYVPKCWILERWLPCRHFGSPAYWASQTCNDEGYLSSGPYPKFGVYVCCYLFANPDHSWLPIFPDLVFLTAQGIWTGRIRKTWEIRDAILSEEAAKEEASKRAFEKHWDETHGVRRGVSYSSGGEVQNTDAEIEAYTRKLITSGVKIKKEEFQPGFRQAGTL